MTVDAKQAAEALNNSEYTEEGSHELFAQMKDAGLVAVFGASDDLMEFRGAIDDEVSCWRGETVYLTGSGLYTAQCEDNDCPHEKRLLRYATELEAIWDSGEGYSWTYKTDIPHVTFDVVETNCDGRELYCRGIVFALADVQ